MRIWYTLAIIVGVVPVFVYYAAREIYHIWKGQYDSA